MITCTYSIDYNFNLSKVFIKVYSTDISIATVSVLLLDSSCIIVNFSHTDQLFTGGFFLFMIVPFSSTESLTEYLIAPVFWVTITLYCQCHTVPPFHSFKFKSRDFCHAPLTLLRSYWTIITYKYIVV